MDLPGWPHPAHDSQLAGLGGDGLGVDPDGGGAQPPVGRHRPSVAAGQRIHADTAPFNRQAARLMRAGAGTMLWPTPNTLSGSYARLSSSSRARSAAV